MNSSSCFLKSSWSTHFKPLDKYSLVTFNLVDSLPLFLDGLGQGQQLLRISLGITARLKVRNAHTLPLSCCHVLRIMMCLRSRRRPVSQMSIPDSRVAEALPVVRRCGGRHGPADAHDDSVRVGVELLHEIKRGSLALQVDRIKHLLLTNGLLLAELVYSPLALGDILAPVEVLRKVDKSALVQRRGKLVPQTSGRAEVARQPVREDLVRPRRLVVGQVVLERYALDHVVVAFLAHVEANMLLVVANEIEGVAEPLAAAARLECPLGAAARGRPRSYESRRAPETRKVVDSVRVEALVQLSPQNEPAPDQRILEIGAV